MRQVAASILIYKSQKFRCYTIFSIIKTNNKSADKNTICPWDNGIMAFLIRWCSVIIFADIHKSIYIIIMY